jgi:FkbM family methyltransferase
MVPDAPRPRSRGAFAAARRALHRALGPRRYLGLMSAGFFAALRLGLLRGRPAFDAHHFLPRLVRPGDTALDVGANLGYYTVPLARLVGPRGRVLAVEPVALYRDVLTRRTRRLPHVQVLPYALGTDDGATVRLGLPEGAEVYRHGLTRVRDAGQGGPSASPAEFEATMRRGSALFAGLDRLDFLKCDVEGYEVPVLPEMIGVIEKHRPVMQVETEGAHRARLVALFGGLGYRPFLVRGERLVALAADPDAPGDVVFVPPARLAGIPPCASSSPSSPARSPRSAAARGRRRRRTRRCRRRSSPTRSRGAPCSA